MFKQKLKVLIVTEASFASTGYGVYGSELIPRLHNSGKYRVAEFASFALAGDPRDHNIKWRYYANDPNPNDQAAQQAYQSNDMNKTGLWRFDKVLIDFQPDIVISFRDSNMEEYMMLSSLRKFFYQIISPSLDSAPQIDSWVGYFLQADAILGYTNYASEVIKSETANKANVIGAAYTGANFNVFKPIKDKKQLRHAYGIPLDANVVGMNGRNQIRKLFPELIKAFRIYLDKVKTIDLNLYNNTFLYLHTTLPDLRTWNINKLLVEYGVASKTLFTYNCTVCHKFFPNKFQDVITPCRFCGKEAILPRVNFNIPPEHLNQVYNLMDLYIQYASAGAAEFPLIEAAAAGCNVMGTDWAGTGDVTKRLEGIPLKILAAPRDINVDADRATMDNDYLADQLIKFFKRPSQINTRNGFKVSELVRRKFSWDKNAEIWMNAIDNAVLKNYQGKWSANTKFTEPSFISDNIPIYDIVYEFLEKNLQEPQLKNTFYIDEMIKFTDAKLRSTGNGVMNWGKTEVINILNNMLKNKQDSESVRCGFHPFNQEDFINYAEMKELANL